MVFLRTHYEVHEFGSEQARDSWEKEGLMPDKVKFCDGLMMAKGRDLDFSSKTDDVDCKRKNWKCRFEKGIIRSYN